MQPTTETNEYFEYVGNGITYRFTKTNPPICTIVMDYSNSRFVNQPKTWQEAMTAMSALETL